MLRYIPHTCALACLPVNGGSSPLALLNRINCPVLLYAVLFCSGSRSNDRIVITRDSNFRWGIFACQPACLPLSLSQFVILSLSYILVFSAPLLFLTAHFFCHSFQHCGVDEKNGSTVRNKTGLLYGTVKVSKESRNKMFQCR